jgi:hypothetical protein
MEIFLILGIIALALGDANTAVIMFLFWIVTKD